MYFKGQIKKIRKSSDLFLVSKETGGENSCCGELIILPSEILHQNKYNEKEKKTVLKLTSIPYK